MTRDVPPEDEYPSIDSVVEDYRNDSAEPDAFKLIFNRYFRPIVRFFTNRGIPYPEAEELAQDVLLSVYKGLRTFRSEAAFDTWLFRITVNRWRNAVRSQSTLAARAKKVFIDHPEPGDTGRAELREEGTQNPASQLLQDELRQIVRQSVQDLPRRMRLCLELRLTHDLSNQEIAALLDISTATVKKQFNLAFKRLGPILAEHIGRVDT